MFDFFRQRSFNSAGPKVCPFNELTGKTVRVRIHLDQYIYGLIAFLALFFRSPDLFRHPRFWAEEGSRDVSTAWSSGPKILVVVFLGNYQFLTNLSSYFASLVPYRFAAYVTTYIAFSVVILVAFLFASALFDRGVSFGIGATFVATLLMLPGGYETFLSATNIQWIAALSFLAILPLREDRINPTLAYVWSVACGLTGVPSCILSPVFLIYGLAIRSKRHFSIGLVLSFCAVAQIFIIVSHGVPERRLLMDLYNFPLSFFLQTIATPTVGPVWTDDLAAWFRNSGTFDLVIPAIVTAAIIAVVAGLSTLPDDKTLSLTISTSWIFVTFVQVFASLTDQGGFVTALGSARYFQFGTWCFCLLACLGTASISRIRRSVSILILGVMFCSGVSAAVNNSWASFFIDGPRWSD